MNTRLRILSAAVLGSSLLASTGTAQIISVPGNHPTIAAALAAATPGTTIAVLPGTYTENLVWPATQDLRLIAPGGPALTTIDGGGVGRVIDISVPVTRATRIEGFTITGGLMATARNHGAGIRIVNGSPTIRGNVLQGNVSDGPNWNYGGAFHVSGGAPRIEGNTIVGNECRNGSWNYGAGIYVEYSTGTEIIGNVVRGNSAVAGFRGNGVGIYIDGSASAVISGNLVVGNIANSQYYNYGVGILVYASSSTSRTVDVVNNTIADNTILATTRPYGALYLAGAGIRSINNIIANNSPVGIYHDSGAVVTADYNCVFGNGTNYSGTTASPNDRVVDPRFVSATDWHLAPTSPCIDAGSNAGVPAAIGTDVDSDPRRSDGNLDGIGGDGARVDIGGDEFCAARLNQTGNLAAGATVTFATTTPNGWVVGTFLAFDTGAFEFEPFGTLLLGATFIQLSAGLTPNSTSIAVPADPGLVGLDVHLQSVGFGPSAAGTFSNRISTTIW